MLHTQLYINSSLDRRPSDSTHDFVVWLNKPIRVVGKKKMYLQLSDIEMPNTVFSLPEYNHIFYYIHDINGLNQELRSIELPTDMIIQNGTSLAALLNTIATTKNYQISFTYNDSNGKIRVTNTSNKNIRILGPYYFEIEQNNAVDACNDRIGFTQDLKNVILLPNQQLYGDSIIRILRTNCYYIAVDKLQNYTSQSVVPNPYKNVEILGRVSCNSFSSLSQIQYGTDTKISLGEINELTNLHITILDDNYELCELNGGSVTMTIKIYLE